MNWLIPFQDKEPDGLGVLCSLEVINHVSCCISVYIGESLHICEWMCGEVFIMLITILYEVIDCTAQFIFHVLLKVSFIVINAVQYAQFSHTDNRHFVD